MIQLSKDNNLLKLPELLYGIIRRIGNLNKEPILYGDVNLLKPGDLYYILGAKQVYRYIKAVSTSNSEDQAEPALPKGLTKGEESELNPDPSTTDPSAPEDSSIKTIVYYFDTIRPLSGNMTDGFVIPEEERGHIRNAGYLFNEIIYSGDANLVDNGSLFYHDTLPFVSVVSNVDGIINLSTKAIIDGDPDTIVTEYRVSPESLHDYSKDYLTFEVLEDGTFTVSINPSAISNYRKLYYSIDEGETWIDIISNLNEPEDDWYYYTSPTITSETNILWKGDIDSLSYNYDKALKIISTFTFNASGNPFFLFRGVDWESASTDYEIGALFSENNKIISAENLYLSFDNTIGGKVFTCRNHYGLNLLFYRCSNLEVAPKTLPNELFESCFSFMFEDCSKLTSVPLDYLPVTTLAPYCYEEMFSGCTNLVQAPELPAIELVNQCYNKMFQGCSKLNYVKAMFTTTPSNTYTSAWLQGVAATGTFVKNASAEWTTTGTNAVPSGWTIETADPEPSDEITI